VILAALFCAETWRSCQQHDAQRELSVERIGHGGENRQSRSQAMPTKFESAVDRYLRDRNLSGRTQNEYLTTLRKWTNWGGGVPIEELGRQDIRDFLDWVMAGEPTGDGAVPKIGSR
jgi:hypothetical protein